ncbi:cytochrome b5-like heme/steroid binding domain-containing protein [Podospora didyma]|uniref:Cytochrome b5-like heme/steroid binding domain-containing protein n=1 Tax=Podospora didyma TaxID=330526 RepID=A0AAE0K5V0_9PEZI|nr:cytochrome b5-like heme/steroid binding domain-containing protein [Podospora didyma]
MAGKFEPKTPVVLPPPKDDIIPVDVLAQANGADSSKCYVAIKGLVYDVTGNKAYQPGGSYNAFAGKDASHALAKTSTKAEDVKPEWQHLDDKEKSTLNDWVTFFSKRYPVVGRVEGATNLAE